ncbi:MAG: SIMPL domain-containing protein [Candidatus Magasanikbacteria bacterium]|uniref:SIMPL domain-containing protein n=1 Tax=Candidatus Magasanikbacteria bacterium CG10_big_fil_rev_8_21_14_0_10_38_6 TaxID=1974647 RepID=A0A2M6P1E1_9BACT|nr:SIMPL domain-containing protein [Candidatus Magasanikbacteria bacterium]NCS71692.1 SIMPL domain-containing protein [Candidatus Magasanikbacteria bacterium]PIR77535.1 MAG: hypothetical protein COU30_01900 [Candidatus Magasanikbacteria bacterium CG10_big_fil_rev_8_21_14_0_10_38_6]
MPVKKSSAKTTRTTKPPVQSGGSTCSAKHLFCNDMIGKIFLTLIGVFLVYGIVFVGTLIRNNIRSYEHIGEADKPERLITIEAEGKVTATPDIATVTMGLSKQGTTVAEAQEQNTTIMNTLIERLTALGIAKEDIQTTNYNVYPQYNYTEEEGQVITGYNVSQNVTVKIRNVDISSQVLALSGELGLNQIGGLQFSIDDTDVYIAQAREEALKKVKEKAGLLSSQLGVNIVSVVSYNEYNREDGYPPYAAYSEYDSLARGGSVPSVEEGSTDIILNVSVTFEIKE